ncbi:hypothetical protein K440DRAFT_642724 [Wilcoxina mikolae CBS 423.85]|nr:hypothetical protein K440DRAFT_642724 [Wilcoxina mikolae CBS 423.85]
MCSWVSINSNHFDTCPKCGYNGAGSNKPTTLPGGINPSLLLDSSPSPQLLLSESNIIVYANKCAARSLRVKQVEAANQQKRSYSLEAHSADDLEDDQGDMEEGLEKPSPTGLEGHSIDQLNIDLADKDIRKWVSLVQVFENIKLNLNKRESKKKGTDAVQQADMYGEGPKYTSFDYYGDEERASKEHGAHADSAIRDTAPVVIEREDGKDVLATIYTAVTFVPAGGKEDATFRTQMNLDDNQTRHRRKRDRLRNKLLTHHHYNHHNHNNNNNTTEIKETLPEQAVGRSGESMMKRVAKIKDLILDEMEYCFIALSPDGDIVITNAATKAVLGQETLEASIGEGFEWIARLDIWRPDFSERLPFEEWALNRLITHHQPLTQVIGMYAGSIPLVVELRGKCIWQDPEKEEGLLAALAIVVDQTKWYRSTYRPVAGMIGLLELLYGTRKDFNPEQLNYIRQIFGSVNSLLLVINDVIDFNKIVTGEVSIVRNMFILQDLVEELETLFTESMAKQGVHFGVDVAGIDKSAFGDGSRLLLLGDDGKIRRIAINILSNAFKFTVRGSVTLRVLTQKVLRNSLEFEDTGVGISEADQLRLFAPLDEITAKDAKAIGLDGIGLNIARNFISLLAGDIGCQSVVDQGTKFWFTIPCGRPAPETKITFGPKEKTLSKTMGIVIHSKELENGQSEKEEDEDGGDTDPKVQIQGTVVMLVEDNWAHQVVMSRRLQQIGCKVLTAVSGRDALGVLKKEDTADGFEATRIIRSDLEYERWNNLPIVGITATEAVGDREKADQCGLNEFLSKPMTSEGIREVVERFMHPVMVGKRRALH